MVYQKARELGKLILESDQAKILDEAQITFNKNEYLKKKFEDFKQFKSQLLIETRQKKLIGKDLENAKNKLEKLSKELEEEEDLLQLLNAEEEFNLFVNKVMSLLKSTIIGDKGCSTKGCGGCGRS